MKSPLHANRGSRKESALSFLRLASSGKVREAYDTYVGPNFKHHNPYYRGDAKSLAAGMEENHGKFPGTTLEVQRALEEGDLVAVYSCVHLKPDGPKVAVVHMFRFEQGRIVELWDVGQVIPEDSSNEYGMF